MRMLGPTAVLIFTIASAGCASAGGAPPGGDAGFEESLLSGGRAPGTDVDAIARRAAVHPLGSRDNPVRADMPQGQQAYLRRLRCPDGRAPAFDRAGNFGAGIYGSIIDGYQVTCGAAASGAVMIYMDMYHPGHVERAPPPGFDITP